MLARRLLLTAEHSLMLEYADLGMLLVVQEQPAAGESKQKEKIPHALVQPWQHTGYGKGGCRK